MPDRFDVVIIGGGMGGYVAAIRAAQLGLRAAVVEEDKLGGTCLHRGCIPTKALLQTASLVDALKHGARLGVTVSGVEVDPAASGRHRDSVVAQLHKGVEFLMRKNRITVLSGHGRLAGAGTVAVEGGRDGGEVEAGAVILASGSRPRQLDGLIVDGSQVITSDEAVRLDRIPASAIVIGAGAVGVEFASLWRSLGAEVTLVEVAERVVPLEDAEIGRELERRFTERGIRCIVGASIDLASLERHEGGVSLTVAVAGREERLTAAVLLSAVGRSANVENLGLEGTRVEVERGTVRADARQATAEPNVFAVGDLAGGFWLAHKAMHQGVVAAEAIAGGDPHPLEPRLVPRTTYCTPQIGSLGLSEEEARAAGRDVSCGVFPFRANGRALIWGEPNGLCKVVTDRATDEVLGVHIIGHEVTELIAGPALGALLEADRYEISRAVAPHPTLSEVLGEAALAAAGQAIHA